MRYVLACSVTAMSMMITPFHFSFASAETENGPICMAGIAADTGRPFTILVLPSRVSGLEGRGFVVEQCGGKELEVETYRNQVCALAQSAPAAVKQSLAANYGIGPDEMCGLARELG